MKLPLILSALFQLSVIAAVEFERLPAGAIQPQLVERDGVIHLIYFKGDAMGGDVFYVRKDLGANKFSPAVQVNSRPGSAIAAGTMRGPQLALGKNGRAHVVWMGGQGAPKVEIGGEKVTPMLYTRLADEKKRFEPERNLITHAPGLDGGGTVAADEKGNVYVLWHGAPIGKEGEQERSVYIARSENEGKRFAPEHPALSEQTGACACCGMKAWADRDPLGRLFVLFRGAEDHKTRPELLIYSKDNGRTFIKSYSDPWEIATCPASSAFIAGSGGHIRAAWETKDNVFCTTIDSSGKISCPFLSPEPGPKRKHPAVAGNQKGEMLLTWLEPAGWGTESTLGWHLFKAPAGPTSGLTVNTGQPGDERGTKKGVPAWSFATAYTKGNGDFVILY